MKFPIPNFVLISVLIVFFYSFTDVPGRIGWNQNRPIQWSDFEGIPDYEDQFRDAVTASALRFTTRCHVTGEFEIYVSAEFVKDQSWVKDVARSNYHLNHERLHFDITELYARKFRQYISTQSFDCNDRDHVQDIVYDYLNQCMEYQHLYDKETAFSLRKEKQRNWQHQVAVELQELEEFASQ